MLKNINNTDISSGTYKNIRFISNSTIPTGIGIPVILAATGLIEGNKNMQLKAVYMLESLLVTEVITYGLKYAVNRPRPFATYPIITQKSNVNSPSFPSGHSSFAFSMATTLSIAYPRWYVIVPTTAYAVSVGYSRMYLGVHYPTDVIAGALIGSGSAFLTYKINKWLHYSKHKSLSVKW